LVGFPDDYQLTVSLNCNCVGEVGAALKISCQFAANSKCRVQIASRCLGRLRTNKTNQHDRRGSASAAAGNDALVRFSVHGYYRFSSFHFKAVRWLVLL